MPGYFNRQNNDDLILAIQSAGVERGRNGFRKNKSTEKNPESEEDLLEHRTNGTDAFNTLYIGCEKFPQHDFYGGFDGVLDNFVKYCVNVCINGGVFEIVVLLDILSFNINYLKLRPTRIKGNNYEEAIIARLFATIIHE